MAEQLQLDIAIPDATAPPEDFAAFARTHLSMFREEAEKARDLSQLAFHRAWTIGKACVALREKLGDDKSEWIAYAKENIGDYQPIARCMMLARMSPDKPPLRDSAQYKQSQIILGNEPPPKTTPRKTDVHKFSNFKAAVTAIRRWWREGDGIKGLDNESLREIRDDLKPIVDIYENIQLRLEAE
jgi:hypothetical protein